MAPADDGSVGQIGKGQQWTADSPSASDPSVRGCPSSARHQTTWTRFGGVPAPLARDFVSSRNCEVVRPNRSRSWASASSPAVGSPLRSEPVQHPPFPHCSFSDLGCPTRFAETLVLPNHDDRNADPENYEHNIRCKERFERKAEHIQAHGHGKRGNPSPNRKKSVLITTLPNGSACHSDRYPFRCPR